MKIAFTVSDACAAAHVGGNVNTFAFTVEVDDAAIPDRLKRAIKDSKDDKAFTAVSCFIIDEDERAAPEPTPLSDDDAFEDHIRGRISANHRDTWREALKWERRRVAQ